MPDARRMLFRIGINLGDVIHDENGSTATASTSRHGSRDRRARRHLIRAQYSTGEARAQPEFQALGPRSSPTSRVRRSLRDRAAIARPRSPRTRQHHALDAGDPVLHRPGRRPDRLLDDRTRATAHEDGALAHASRVRSREPDLAASLSGSWPGTTRWFATTRGATGCRTRTVEEITFDSLVGDLEVVVESAGLDAVRAARDLAGGADRARVRASPSRPRHPSHPLWGRRQWVEGFACRTPRSSSRTPP